jgi:valyl-tRNA synthetase
VEARWRACMLEALQQESFSCQVSQDGAQGPQDRDLAYAIAIPPPNVTGVLTMGHVLNNTLQDVLARRARQQGKRVRWIPGTDHAGIATQVKVEKALKEQEGKTKEDLGREAFLARACDWRDKHGGIILEQLKALGASCAWQHTVHTLDPDYSHGVLTAFVRLYKEGFIYKGQRMVNWCPVSQTALSDEEVQVRNVEGQLCYVRYELVDEPGHFITVATTRPETIMADVALAVNPEDPRYTAYIGRQCYRPLQKAPIPILADSSVGIDFGTGVLKVTPAHDALDFEIGKRHHLPLVDILNPDGTLNAHAGEAFQGLDRFEARRKAIAVLRSHGHLVELRPHTSAVGYSERGQVPIEPRVSQQWFLRYPRVEEAKAVVASGKIRFFPERWTKNYLHWLDNIQDWCISRQLWWGHRIPVWYKKGADHQDPQHWYVGVEPPQDPEQWEQDEDVLDTWFSSWLWPLGILGWPDAQAMQAKAFKAFYPTADLVTGPDILFFWVARMIMAGLAFVPDKPLSQPLSEAEQAAAIPFGNVYFTGIIRDAQGRKMSKSLGNSPNPLDLIQQHGADGLRLGILSMAPQGQDIHFSQERIAQGQHFCNKLWNACRFRQMAGSPGDLSSWETILSRLDPQALQVADLGILVRLVHLLEQLERDYSRYEFNATTQHLYAFFWSDWCDGYLELVKGRLQDPGVLAVQDFVLGVLLQQLYPIIPFVSEELWHSLGYAAQGGALHQVRLLTAAECTQKLLARGLSMDPQAAVTLGELRQVISQLRMLKAQNGLATQKQLTLVATPQLPEHRQCFVDHQQVLQRVVGFGQLQLDVPAPVGVPVGVTQWGQVCWVGQATEGLSPAAQQEQQARLEAELSALEEHIRLGEAKLQNPTFLNKAPPKVVEGAKALLAANCTKRQELQLALKRLREA